MSNQELCDEFTKQGFKTTELDLGGVIAFFPGVLFEFDKYELTPEAITKVTNMATLLNDNRVKKRNLLLEGHTDSNGSDEFNLKLSQNRAEAVYQKIFKK